MPFQLRPWLQLLRAPNLFTVPGDPFVGFLLASYGFFSLSVFSAIAAALCFYSAGLIDNDLADLHEDLTDRPLRPLPSNAISPTAARLARAAFLTLGFLFTAPLGVPSLITAALLALSLFLYNHSTKSLPIIGALNMGACRGLSLLLGATAAPHSDLLPSLLLHVHSNPLLIATLTLSLYIAAITHLARYETLPHSPSHAKWLPPIVLTIGSLTFLTQLHPPTLYSAALILAVACFNAFSIASQLSASPPPPTPPFIGQLIRLLLLLQTALCASVTLPQASLAAALLLIAWPISRSVSQRFYAS